MAGTTAQTPQEGARFPEPGGRALRAGESSRRGRWALALGLLIHAVFLVSLRTHWLDPLFTEASQGFGQASDYFGIYQAGQNLLDGRSIYDSADYRNEAVPRVPYFYFYRYLPPTAYFAALDAWLLSPWPAYWVWVAFNELLLVWLIVLLLRTPAGTAKRRDVMAGLALAFTPFYIEQFMGQFSFLMALFLWFPLRAELLASVRSERTGHDAMVDRGGAGGQAEILPSEKAVGIARSHGITRVVRRFEFWAWSAAIALKTFPALFAVVYWKERRFARVVAAAGAVAIASLPYYLQRPEDLLHFMRLNLRPLPPEIELGRFGMTSLVQSLSAHWLGAHASRTIDLGIKQLYLSSIPVYLWIGSLLLVAAWVTWRARGRTLELLALWVAAFFCIYKDVWEYHHVMLLPVLFTLGLGTRSVAPLIFLALLALPTPYHAIVQRFGTVPVPEWPTWAIVAHFGAKALVVLGLFGWTLARCLRDDGSGARAAGTSPVGAERRFLSEETDSSRDGR